jgi:predicted ATPase
MHTFQAYRSNLPRMPNPLIGREREVDEITALVRSSSLVTLVGAGGLGKTRISLHVAARLLGEVTDGVWFVELAPLTSGDYLPSTIARALGLTVPTDGDPVDNLVRALRSKHLLLILDSCEHLIVPVARTISALLRGCPHVRVLASSRQALGLAGESMYRMPTLGVPTALKAAMLTAAEAPSYPAIALFVERTRAVDPRFEVTDDNAPTIADICRRLDGIALAIELAASCVTILTPRQLRDGLDERFRVISDGSRDLPRQQTLRTLIDWSHDQLDDRERMLFRRLAIFINGFTIESAAAVCAADDLESSTVAGILASLVEKLLVAAEGDAESKRYRLLESTRAFALERLDAAGERTALANRHLRHLRERFAEFAAGEARTGSQDDRFAAFVAELEDIRAALHWALASDHVDDGAHLLVDLSHTWVDDGLETEQIAWCGTYLAAIAPDAFRLLARISADLAQLLNNQGLIVRTRELAPRAVACARAANDPTSLIRALWALAWMHLRDNQIAETDRALSEAEQIPEPTVNDRLLLMETRAVLHYLKENYDAAILIFTEIRREQDRLGNPTRALFAAMNIAEAEYGRGETRRAIAIAREVLPEARRNPDTTLFINLACNLAGFLVAVDDVLGGGAFAREVIALLSDDQPTHFSASLAVGTLALAYAIVGDRQRAAVLAGYSDAALAAIGYVRNTGEQRGYDRLMNLLRAGLDASELERMMAEGAAREPAAAFALAIDGIA